jgi:hypothetical protein
MAIEKIFAHISCSNLERSKQWYAKLFGRSADIEPMQHLAEWHHADSAGVQLFEDQPKSGKSTLTLIVNELEAEHARLAEVGLNPGRIESGDKVSLIRLNDLDGNLIVLAQKGHV